MRPRLWTTLPLPTINTPCARSGASRVARSRWYVERLQRVDRKLHHGDVGVGVDVGQDGPGAMVDAPAVVVEADPMRRGDLGHLGGDVG